MTPSEKSDSYTRKTFAFDLLSDDYQADWCLKELHREFARHDYVHLPNLFSAPAWEVLVSEIRRLERFALPRNFLMPDLETPRIMHALGGARIIQESPLLSSLYFHQALWSLLIAITGTKIYASTHPEEFMVANFLVGSGQTHGWHLDDPAYAIIIFLEAPEKPTTGGLLEFIPNWLEYCDTIGADPRSNITPTAEQARTDGLIRTRHHNAGDAYLLRADKSLHRVTSLREPGARRVVLNLGYESRPTTEYGSTASMLYSETLTEEGH